MSKNKNLECFCWDFYTSSSILTSGSQGHSVNGAQRWRRAPPPRPAAPCAHSRPTDDPWNLRGKPPAGSWCWCLRRWSEGGWLSHAGEECCGSRLVGLRPEEQREIKRALYAAGDNVYEQTSDHIIIQGILHLGQSFSSCSSVSYQLQMKTNINKQQHQLYCDPLLLK